MTIACPYCAHEITLKGVKPGHFRPSCPRCGKPFRLMVPDDPAKPTTAEPIPAAPPVGKPPAPSAPLGPTEATGDFSSPAPPPKAAPARPRSPAKAAPAPRASTEATGEWQPPAGLATAPHRTAAQESGDRGATTPPPTDPDRTVPDTGPAASQAAPRAAGKKTPKTAGSRGKAEEPADAPETLGGYQVLKRLGQGGMGTVYLARQVSLDRKVALKTMNPEWADNPRFLTRFIREAYAAAQLVHHNIVQIYDIGEDGGTHFFSMEFVPGTNLGQLVDEQGKLDVETAVGYILQAARGLKFAHDQGMVHRDVKPDNLMINDQGIVKVADLGLVKTPGVAAAEEADEEGDTDAAREANVTAAGVAMGTPAYMAPEQGTNAAGVDQRADVYSLGCTLYALLTGRPPFQGKSALEVMSKHQTEPIVRPERIEKRVPLEVADVLMKMLAKRPEDRYPDLAAVIKDLEKFLGVHSAGPFSPREEHANTLEEAAKEFHAAPAARLRSLVVPGFFAACAALVLLCFLFGWVKVGMGFFGLALLTGLFGFVVTGLANKTHLFQKARELVLDGTWGDWLTWTAGLLLLIGVLWLADLFPVWVGALVLAAGLVAIYHALVDRKLAAQRQLPLEKAERLLKSLRLKGVEEEALQQFVCKYSGYHWEEFYETLYGYEAMLEAREAWGRAGTGRHRPRHAAWRDPVVRWLESTRKARKAARERRLLAKLEARALQAKGLSEKEAREQAEDAAEVIVNQAAVLQVQARGARKKVTRPAVAETPTVDQAPAPRVTVRTLTRSTYRVADAATRPRIRHWPLRNLFRRVMSPKVRFLGGVALLALCLLWVRQNGLLSTSDVTAFASERLSGETSTWTRFRTRLEMTTPLQLPAVPLSVTAPLFNSFLPGLAGLLLIVSALAARLQVVALCLAGALVALVGPLVPLPEGLPLDRTLLWGIAAGTVGVLGLILGRFVR